MDELSRIATKLVILQQCSLELLDELKNTALYRHDIKFAINNLERKLEEYLNGPLNTLDDSEREETFMGIQRGVHKLLSNTLEEIYMTQDETDKRREEEASLH
jgi:hypothetical protein